VIVWAERQRAAPPNGPTGKKKNMAVDHGMNVAEIEQIGTRLQTHFAARIQEISAEIESIVGSTSGSWIGPDAERFRSWWPAKRSFMQRTADDIHGFGQAALNDVSEQRLASGETTSSASGAVDWSQTSESVLDDTATEPERRSGRYEMLLAPGGGGTKVFIPDDGGAIEVVEVYPNGAAIDDDGERNLFRSVDQSGTPEAEPSRGGYWYEYPDNEATRKLGLMAPGGGRIWIPDPETRFEARPADAEEA
jgi:hypothetical protein